MKSSKFKVIFIFLLITHYSLLITSKAVASEYVLPYPSYMPGHRLYRLEKIWDKLQRYWHFGNIAKFKYNLSMADKKLVEAKTLFEYKQYLLAIAALNKSDEHFQECKVYLRKAKEEGKEISQKQEIFLAASEKRRKILNNLLDETPSTVIWQEENKQPMELYLHKEIMKL